MGFLKKIYLLGGPVPAARLGGGGGRGRSGVRKKFTFCIHIWSPHEILSVLRIQCNHSLYSAFKVHAKYGRHGFQGAKQVQTGQCRNLVLRQ